MYQFINRYKPTQSIMGDRIELSTCEPFHLSTIYCDRYLLSIRILYISIIVFVVVIWFMKRVKQWWIGCYGFDSQDYKWGDGNYHLLCAGSSVPIISTYVFGNLNIYIKFCPLLIFRLLLQIIVIYIYILMHVLLQGPIYSRKTFKSVQRLSREKQTDIQSYFGIFNESMNYQLFSLPIRTV